jgi:hypothetical protein
MLQFIGILAVGFLVVAVILSAVSSALIAIGPVFTIVVPS